MLHSIITRQLGLSWIRGRLSGEPKLSSSISNINHSDYFSTKSLAWRRGGVGGLPLISQGEMMSALVEKILSLLVNLRERLDRENWATTMVLLPKAHICSAAQHWAGDFCPSVLQHSLIFKLITMTAIISAGHSAGLICWTAHKGRNTNYVSHRLL